jgi:hypothetical protein
VQKLKKSSRGWLRRGDAYTSNGIVGFTKQLLAHLPNKKHILFHGDSGFFSGALLYLLEKYGHGYLIKVTLKGLKKLLIAQQWTPVPGQPRWEQSTFVHQCTNWSTSRLFMAVRLEKPADPDAPPTLFKMKDYDYFCYVISQTCQNFRNNLYFVKENQSILAGYFLPEYKLKFSMISAGLKFFLNNSPRAGFSSKLNLKQKQYTHSCQTPLQGIFC